MLYLRGCCGRKRRFAVKNLAVVAAVSGLLVYAPARAGDIALRALKSAALVADTNGRTTPRYENGFIISCASTLGSIWVFDEAGVRVRDVRVVLPDADFERINSTAVSRDGRLVAAVTFYSADGKMAKGLAWIGSSGEITKVVRTSPFAVRQLSFADDGTLWALGDVYDDTFTNHPVGPYDLLWHFDSNGNRIGTALPVSSFETRHQVGSRSLLAVSADRIG